MTPRNDLLDHAMNLFPPPEHALEQVTRRHGRRQRNRRLGAALLGVAIAIGLILGTTGVLRSSQRPAHEGPTGPQPPASPTIAFTAWKVPGGDPDHEQVYVARPDGSVTQITHGANHRAVTWSPDGSELIVLRGLSEIWSIAADGSSPVRLAEVGPNRFGSAEVNVHFSPDGSLIAFQRDRDLFVMDADGTDQRKIASHADDFFVYGTADFSWSPDGSRIAFAKGYQGSDGLYTVHPDGTGLEPLGTGALERAEHPSWSPDGSTIAFSGYRPGAYGDNVFVMDLDGGAPIQVAKGYSPTWSPDGSQIAVDQNGSILVISQDGSQKASLPGCNAGIDWSPEGAQVVVVGTLPEGGGRCRGIFIEDTPISDSGPLERTNVARLPAPAMIYLPRWQPSN